MSEQAESLLPLSLDVVKARIFYLACDVEPHSPPAAMLLRAVADAIDDSQRPGLDLSENMVAQGAPTPLFSSLRHQTIGAREQDPERRFGIVSSNIVRKR